MEILQQKIEVQYTRLQKFTRMTSANELMNLSKPCYYPSHQKYFFQFLQYMNFNIKDVKDFPKRYWTGHSGITNIHKDHTRMFYVYILHTLLNNVKWRGLYPSMMLLIGIREYSNLMHRQIRYCNEDLFRYALEHMAKTHLFSREKTIGNGVYFLSKEMIKKYTPSIQSMENRDHISKFIQEYRSRLSQSIKSFAGIYYKASKENIGIKTAVDDEENRYQSQTQERSTAVIDDIVKKITVYKEIDKQAMMDAKKITKISTTLATQIAHKLCNMKYTDNIRTALQLYVKRIKSVGGICGKGYYAGVKTLMGIKRTKDTIYFKQQINELLLMLLKDLKYDRKYNMLTNQTKFSINSYLAYYLTMLMRNDLCGLTADKRKFIRKR